MPSASKRFTKSSFPGSFISEFFRMNADQFREFMGGIQELVKGRQSSGGERVFEFQDIFGVGEIRR